MYYRTGAAGCVSEFSLYNTCMTLNPAPATLTARPAYVQCGDCVYWVPVSEIFDGRCEECATIHDYATYGF